MHRYHAQRLLSYRCEQLFSLVLDIERYPDFVPGYRSARVVRADTNAIEVEQRVGFGPAQFGFKSRADFVTPRQIVVSAHDGPLRQLEVDWQFTDQEQGCLVTVETRYQAGGLLAPLVDGWVALVSPRLLDIFATRARRLYGAAG